MASIAEIFGASFPTPAQSASGSTYGPNGDDYTGTLPGTTGYATPAPIGTMASIFGAVFLDSSGVQSGVAYGPTGSELTGTAGGTIDDRLNQILAKLQGTPISSVSVRPEPGLLEITRGVDYLVNSIAGPVDLPIDSAMDRR